MNTVEYTYHVVPTREAHSSWVYHAMRLIQEASKTRFTGPLVAGATARGFYDHFISRSSLLAVALAPDGTVVGTASLKYLTRLSSRYLLGNHRVFYPWLLSGCPCITELGYVAVSSDASMRGVASKLCSLLLAETNHTVYSTVHTTNIPSLCLVRKLGFQPLGRVYTSRHSDLDVALYQHRS